MTRRSSEHDVLIATIGKPHGVRGLVRLYPATETADIVEALGALYDDHGEAWQVCWIAPGIAVLKDVKGRPLADRTEAEKLVNRRLYVARDALPETEEEEFYHIDLLNMEGVLRSGETLGRVVKVHDYGAGTSLEFDQGQLVPFTRACVPELDWQARRLVVELPEAIEVEGDLSGDVSVRS
ncbi:16S rRNA processing protein RimM [Saccharibacter sp. 17.LH.SD]|uniref:ribosome maturation factor RimM n=1 Tax=Saccharibacter sp. 17.LH.SD TaxID=2689393 RepID=UPI001369DD05|nr:ribosome maturation factor RimM [Saccharibacter sp. 17.LH.SD]MXV44730.1 16S rRNA processing protein RimM [Saccharibacter sp. 17.LH.SD]